LIPLKDNIPTESFPVLTVALIVINVLTFLFFQDPSLSFSGASVDEQNVVDYGAIPYEITHPGEQCEAPGLPAEVACSEGGDGPSTWVTLFTSIFMHGGILHIAGNMLFLWVFGNNIEEAMGRIKFILFYLGGGMAATFAQVLIDTGSTVPSIGASGAVAAVLGAYALLYPRARVVTLIIIIVFITVIELPALLVLGLWFLMQLYYGSSELTQPVAGGGVAYWAHIGGFIFGLALVKLLARRENPEYGSYNPRPGVY
jgi:membrane associated rhomboid family serine protease